MHNENWSFRTYVGFIADDTLHSHVLTAIVNENDSFKDGPAHCRIYPNDDLVCQSQNKNDDLLEEMLTFFFLIYRFQFSVDFSTMRFSSHN